MRLRNFMYSISIVFSVIFGYSEIIHAANAKAQTKTVALEKSDFDRAVELIMKYEGLHKNHGQLIGYGHKVVAGEPYRANQNLTQAQAEKLLRQDLAKLCEKYRSFGKDSLLLSALAYNCGTGAVAKSSVYKKLLAGDRNIKANYLSYCKANGKVLSQLQKRRNEEFETLFVLD